jgi:hypothetical protein
MYVLAKHVDVHFASKCSFAISFPRLAYLNKRKCCDVKNCYVCKLYAFFQRNEPITAIAQHLRLNIFRLAILLFIYIIDLWYKIIVLIYDLKNADNKSVTNNRQKEISNHIDVPNRRLCLSVHLFCYCKLGK